MFFYSISVINPVFSPKRINDVVKLYNFQENFGIFYWKLLGKKYV